MPTGTEIAASTKTMIDRYSEAVRTLGTGNAAGVLAMVAALHTFTGHAQVLPWIRTAAIVFAIGVFLFALAYLSLVCAYIFMEHYTAMLDKEGASVKSIKSHDASVGGMYATALCGLASTACFFVAMGLAFIALLRL